jgi:hypothetical protein
MNNWEIDEDLFREEKRLDELDRVQSFFIWFYSIPDDFRAWTNYKQGDKYCIELSTNDKKCTMKLEIDRKMYDIVNNYVTLRDTDTINMEDIMHYLIQKSGRKEDK